MRAPSLSWQLARWTGPVRRVYEWQNNSVKGGERRGAAPVATEHKGRQRHRIADTRDRAAAMRERTWKKAAKATPKGGDKRKLSV